MYFLMLDTCVLLDLASKKSNSILISALEELIDQKQVEIIVNDIIRNEFDRYKDDILFKENNRIIREIRNVRNVFLDFEYDNKILKVIDDMKDHVQLQCSMKSLNVNKVRNIICNKVINTNNQIKIRAVERALSKKAPFHKNNNSVADAIIIEQFSDFIDENWREEDFYIFVTHNYKDFSGIDRRKPHEDFNEIFEKENVEYFNSLSTAIRKIDIDVLTEKEFEDEIIEEYRSLNEIYDSIDELIDKIWYNRHQNLKIKIQRGEIIVSEYSSVDSNNIISKEIWENAKKAAIRLEERYDDLGPWDDFEWGMLNGKLSALRWVAGEEWDMLDI